MQLLHPTEAEDDIGLKYLQTSKMATLMPMEAPPAGFNFENCKRNAMLAGQGFKPPKVSKDKYYFQKKIQMLRRHRQTNTKPNA